MTGHLRLRLTALFLLSGCLLAGLTLAWVRLDHMFVPPSDSEHHLLNALLFARSMEQGGLTALWQTVRKLYEGWPPAAPALLYGPLGHILGGSLDLIRVLGLALVPFLMWGVYRLASRLGNSLCGAVAVVLTLFSFGVVGQLRQLSLDLPAATMVLVTMLTALRSMETNRLKHHLALGGLCGLCMATRVQAAFFLAGPALVWLVWRFRRGEGRRAPLDLLLMIASGLAVSSPWWYGRLDNIWACLTLHLSASSPLGGRGGAAGLGAGFLWYLRALGAIAGWPVLVFMLGGLPLLWTGQRRASRGGRLDPSPWMAAALACQVLGGILGCASGVHRETRYLLPALPACAVLASIVLAHIPVRIRGMAASALTIAAVLPCLWVVTHPMGPHAFLLKNQLLPLAYVREPIESTPARLTAQDIIQALRKEAGAADGEGTYLLMLDVLRMDFVHHMVLHVLDAFPRMTFGSTLFSNGVVNTPWHRGQRATRRVLAVTMSRRDLDLKEIWQEDKVRHLESKRVRLYEVPPRHPLRGRLDGWETLSSTFKGGLNPHRKRWTRGKACSRDADCILIRPADSCGCMACGPAWRRSMNRRGVKFQRRRWRRPRCRKRLCEPCEAPGDYIGLRPFCLHGICSLL